MSRPAAATAVRRALPIETLRDMARSDRDAARRLPAALALAVLDDEAAYTVMRSDPVWSVRDRVGRMLAGWREPPDSRPLGMTARSPSRSSLSAIGLMLQPVFLAYFVLLQRLHARC